MKNNQITKIILSILLVGAIITIVLQNKKLDKLRNRNGLNKILTTNDNIENFDRFLYRFCLDTMFQVNRIKFPIKLSYRVDFENQDAPLLDTILSLRKWKHDDLFYDQVTQAQIFDNHAGTFRNTKERIVHFRGVENGRDLAYFFEADGEKWFMTKIVNKGD